MKDVAKRLKRNSLDTVTHLKFVRDHKFRKNMLQGLLSELRRIVPIEQMDMHSISEISNESLLDQEDKDGSVRGKKIKNVADFFFKKDHRTEFFKQFKK